MAGTLVFSVAVLQFGKWVSRQTLSVAIASDHTPGLSMLKIRFEEDWSEIVRASNSARCVLYPHYNQNCSSASLPGTKFDARFYVKS